MPLLFFLTLLVETNRTPYDVAEAEGELVGGYYVEYTSLSFALFFLAEYGNITSLSVVLVLLYFGG